MTRITVTMREWRRRGPREDKRLAGLSFGDDHFSRRQAESLTDLGRVEILELAEGLRIRSNSYVGNVQLGELRIIIQPKISGRSLVNLIRYAYGLRNLELFETGQHRAPERAPFKTC